MSKVTLDSNVILKISHKIAQIEERVERHQTRLLTAFQKYKVSESHLRSSTGYGYDDLGRETLEQIVADVFGGELALVRPNIISGTHAIASCLYGSLRPGDEWIALTGRPYDTLFQIIGSPHDGTGSLSDFGINYHEIALTSDNKVDWTRFQQKVTQNTKLVAIQRSRGYSNRPSFTIAEIEKMIEKIREIVPNAIIFVDNCYGEFVEDREPLHVGADLIAGSLIKNVGGGLAKSGGYIAGKKLLVERAAARLVAPGIGMEGGATHGYLADYYQGLFLAPHVVGEALKGMIFASALFEEQGYVVSPTYKDKRTDIIQQIELGTAEKLVTFCQAIQSASPIDAHVRPEPSDMPGYADPVIMAAGTFVQGASIELSADGPLREPYTVYLQGGLTYAHVKIAIKTALLAMKTKME
ncbi:aminotransferase class I/II-fold pyridoxal phosphate-dependent enzyme [Shimazuella kribbensis]|uniref:methionine gamma-lyase family protein n=1 Tax=Shimazuella kribbensis TaxID=139808 RepID=UPI000407E23D|nr:methionine gamma-lyase family protein [Shimazuella kribbensis]